MSIESAFDPALHAVIDPCTNHLRRERKLDACIINFSFKIMDALIEQDLLELVEENAVHFASCCLNLYTFKGTNIGIIQTQVGAAFTASLLEDVAYSFSCDKFILFGSCGGLDRDLVAGKLIVPTAAYRDEGVSYHYVPAADYIEVKNHDVVAEVFEKLHIPYVKGRCWTTDAFFRETRRNMERRKAEGCIAVDMELSAIQAVCDFRGYELYDFIYTGDNLDGDEWDEGILTNISIDERLTHFYIALEIAKHITEG